VALCVLCGTGKVRRSQTDVLPLWPKKNKHGVHVLRPMWRCVFCCQRGVTMVKTVVQPKPLSSYLIDVPSLPTVEQVTVSVPVLQLPGVDDRQATPSLHLEVGAAGMLQVRTSTVGRGAFLLTALKQSSVRPSVRPFVSTLSFVELTVI